VVGGVLRDREFLQTSTSDLAEFVEDFSELIFSPVEGNTVNVQVGLKFSDLLLHDTGNVDWSVFFDLDRFFTRVIGHRSSV
jgi:hypothetical protein